MRNLMLNVVLVFCACLITGVTKAADFPNADFPNADSRVAIFDRFVSELERLDAEGLPPRKSRPETWKVTTAKLREQARAAQTPHEFGLVFTKLDMSYPNLHAIVTLSDEYNMSLGRVRARIGARFGPQEIFKNKGVAKYVISSIDTPVLKDMRESMRPAIGDEVLKINDRSIADWATENFIYCKFPYRVQCESNFFDSFRKGYLSWNWTQPLKYTLQRNGRVWTTDVPYETQKAETSQSTTSAALKDFDCPAQPDRYFEFAAVYAGRNICVFESPKHPSVVLLRLASFAYRGIPAGEKIQTLDEEVSAFFEKYWQSRMDSTKTLIIDLIDNGGGDTPVEWYRIFYPNPFQEQFVQFKKLTEFEDAKIRQDLFYGDDEKEIWLDELKKSGKYAKIKVGDFLPPVPQFCATP
ncbi:MAG: hypothetical protein V4692_06210, partial [Bdellovibrionota bacterium]